MKPSRFVRALAGLCCCALGTLGCGSGEPRYVFVSNNDAQFWTIAAVGFKDAAAKHKVPYTFERPSPGNAARQKEIIDSLLVRGIAGIAVSANDRKNQREYFDEIAARTNLITVDNDVPESKRQCYLGTDNYEAGKAAGELVKRAMPEGGTVVIFVGKAEAPNAIERRQGVLDALAGKKNATGAMYGSYKLVGLGDARGPYTDETDVKVAKQNADDVLTKLEGEGETKVCMVGLWAYNPPAIYEAVKSKKLQGKVKIVGFDEDDNTLAGIIAGDIYGTVVQNPYEFGYQALEMLVALAKNDRSKIPADKLIHVPYRIVLPQVTEIAVGTHKAEVVEVNTFRKKLRELMGK